MPPLDQESRGSDLPSQKVSLGCGTLILIALIVLIFSNSGAKENTRQLNEIKTELTKLREEVASLGRTIEAGQQPR